MICPRQMAVSQLSGYTAFTGADDISIESGIVAADVATVSFTKTVLRHACGSYLSVI